jgi:hypothetical protein
MNIRGRSIPLGLAVSLAFALPGSPGAGGGGSTVWTQRRR